MATNDANFPKPYINTITAEDSMIVRVPMKHLGIGARASGMPNSIADGESMKIQHVGGSKGSK